MIEEKVKAVMAKVFNVRTDDITEASDNENIERWDSLGHMNLCLALEQTFGVELDGDRVASMHSFNGVVSAVKDALQN